MAKKKKQEDIEEFWDGLEVFSEEEVVEKELERLQEESPIKRNNKNPFDEEGNAVEMSDLIVKIDGWDIGNYNEIGKGRLSTSFKMDAKSSKLSFPQIGKSQSIRETIWGANEIRDAMINNTKNLKRKSSDFNSEASDEDNEFDDENSLGPDSEEPNGFGLFKISPKKK
jgi:hypothetical protein